MNEQANRTGYEPLTDQKEVLKKLTDLSKRSKITYRDMFEVVADTFASGAPEKWRQTGERWLTGQSSSLVVGYYEGSQGVIVPQSWVQVNSGEGSDTYEFHLQRRGVVPYKYTSELDVSGRRTSLPVDLRRSIVFGLIHGI